LLGASSRSALDLYMVAPVAAIDVFLLLRHGGQLILRYYAVAFVTGLIVTAAIKATRTEAGP
jgi:hypothetical protein